MLRILLSQNVLFSRHTLDSWHSTYFIEEFLDLSSDLHSHYNSFFFSYDFSHKQLSMSMEDQMLFVDSKTV